ncbi:MAG: hypothetical protein JJ897_20915 [Marinibacterium sp.]|nr:hypothetical protein [Marinibacterium sp.]
MLVLFMTVFGVATVAQRAEPPMKRERLAAMISAVDPEVPLLGGKYFELTIDDVSILVVTDPLADRMKAMVRIRSAEGLEPKDLLCVMHANFDAALDARYAVARGR